MPFDCCYCKKTFCWSSHLRRHERGCKSAPTIHLIQCSMCKYSTSRLDVLKQHEKTHEDKTYKAKTYEAKTHEADGGEWNRGKRKCPVCHVEFCGTPIEPHFRAEHGIHMKWQNLEFAEFEVFETWLRNLEEGDGVQFTKRCFKGRKDGSKKIIFSCFRNGFYNSKAKVRNEKRLGSNKINGYCPAKITINLLADGTVRGEHQEVHVGHELREIRRLRLLKTEREDLKEKISLKIPFEEILNGVKRNIGNQLRRQDIVSRKDLHNIAKFNSPTSMCKRKIDQKEVYGQEAYDVENTNSNDAIMIDSGDEICNASKKQLQAKPICSKDLTKKKKKTVEKCAAIINQIDSDKDLNIFLKNINQFKRTIQGKKAASVNTLGKDEKNKTRNTGKQRRLTKK